MSIYRVIESFLERVIEFFWKLFILIHEFKNIWLKRSLWLSYKPNEVQKRGAHEFWKRATGMNWPLWWHRLYASYTGKWDDRYTPEILFSVRLEPNSSRRCDRLALGDKNNLQLFIRGGDLRLPEEYMRCSSGLIVRARGGVPLSE